MKSIKLLSFVFFTLLSANMLGYPQFKYNGLRYELDTDKQEVILIGLPSEKDETIYLPSTVPYEGTLYPVTMMSAQGFYQCWWLSKVVIPSSIREILPRSYDNPFDACLNLQTIEVETSNEWLCAEDNVLYDKDKTVLYCYPGGKTPEMFTVPDGVNYISSYAFSRNPHIVEINLPQTVKVIELGAFDMCLNLKRVNIPSNVEIIKSYLFYECTSLEFVDIPESVTVMGMCPFGECSRLRRLVIRGVIDAQSLSLGLVGIPESATIYVQPSEIDKYKQYFAGSVLPLEAYNPTAIHEISINQNANRDSVNSAWYDLSGRRVDGGLLPRGIYIRDGKKVVVK